MKLAYILVCLSIAACVLGCKYSAASDSQIDKRTDTMKVQENESSSNPYHDLRNQALAVTADQLELQLPDNEVKVYGVVLDWKMGEGIATLVAFQTGDASYYLSTGGGAIGGAHHENVKKATIAFTDKAQIYLSLASRIETTPLPEVETVRFYFLTNKGKFFADEDMQNFNNESSKWLELFEEAIKVITELRLTTQENRNEH